MSVREKTKNALLSVYNKEGIVEFAKQLVGLGFNIYASGGTAKKISSAGIKVTDVASLVGGKAILGHRVVTLSREVHAGLLARDIPEDIKELEALGIPRLDLVRCDMYPLREEINRPESTFESVIEKTDIGGPTMIRSAAKGGRIVICDFTDQDKAIQWLKDGGRDQEFLRYLAAKAEFVVADYCLASAQYHGQGIYQGLLGKRVLECNYGENPYQKPAALFSTEANDPLALDKFNVITSGMPLSYNNMCDIDRLLNAITHIAAAFFANFGKIPKIAIAVKHGNPCGASCGADKVEILRNMIIGDTRAIFGGLVITNFQICKEEAETLIGYSMSENKARIFDGIIAPSFDKDAFEFLSKRAKCRLVVNKALGEDCIASLDSSHRFRYVRGGFLAQPNYGFVARLADENMDIYGDLTEEQKRDLLLAWAIGCTSNSNTVTLVKDNHLIGNGVGQQDRIGCCELAIKRAVDAKHDTKNAVAYSDSFFPFVDGPETLAEAGVLAIFTSSGSIRDKEVIEFCQSKGIALCMIPDKIGRGFFGH